MLNKFKYFIVLILLFSLLWTKNIDNNIVEFSNRFIKDTITNRITGVSVYGSLVRDFGVDILINNLDSVSDGGLGTKFRLGYYSIRRGYYLYLKQNNKKKIIMVVQR